MPRAIARRFPRTAATRPISGSAPVLITFWSVKGGSGATVTAAVHALAAAEVGPTLLVDLDGDLPDALGVATPSAGLADWLAAGAAVPADALDRLAVPVTGDLRLLTRGTGPLDAGTPDASPPNACPADEGDRGAVLAGLLAATPRTVVVDAGTRPGAVGRAVARASDRSVLVTRACYLAVRRQLTDPLHPTDVVLVREPGRALGPAEVAEAAGVAACTVLPHDPTLARAVDAGLLTARLPGRIRRQLGRGLAA